MKNVAIAIVIGIWVISLAPGTVLAQQSGPPKPGTGTVSYAWDLDNDGYYSLRTFATFFDSGQVIADGVRVTDTNPPSLLGNGHGTWFYRQQDHTLHVRTIHSEIKLTDSLGLFVVTSNLNQVSARSFAGTADIQQFSSLEAFLSGMPPVWRKTVGVKYDHFFAE
jgi:hypothetical protein